MPDSSDIADQIAENVAAPASATQDGRSATQHNLKDQIEVARFARERETESARNPPFRMFGTRPPGTT